MCEKYLIEVISGGENDPKRTKAWRVVEELLCGCRPARGEVPRRPCRRHELMTTSADIDAMRAQMQVGADGTTPAASAGLFGTFQNSVPGCSVRNVPVTLAT